MPGPRFLIAGPYFTGGARRTGPFRGIDSPEEARRVVDEWAGRGATWFKVLGGPGDVLRWLTDAAHAASFADSAHLSRSFRRTFGIAPTVLRHPALTLKLDTPA